MTSPPPAAVLTRALSKRYGSRAALQPLDLEVAPGETLALLGPNGAGKSTLLRLLASLSRPSGGEAWLFGRRVERGPGASPARRRLGYVGHALLLYRPLSVRQNLEFFSRLYGMDRIPERLAALLERFGLSDRENDPVGALSRGLQQRVSLARAFAHEPDLLLLDEPFTGLDGDGSNALSAMLSRASAAGTTLLLATHDLGRAAEIAGRVAVLHRGRLAHLGPAPGGEAALVDLLRAVARAEAA
jgi:heme exporter protein A